MSYSSILQRAITATRNSIYDEKIINLRLRIDIVTRKYEPCKPAVEDIVELDDIEGASNKIIQLNQEILKYVECMIEDPRKLGYEVSLDGELYTQEELVRRHGEHAYTYIDKRSLSVSIGATYNENNTQSYIGKYTPVITEQELEAEDELFMTVSEYFVIMDHNKTLQEQLCFIDDNSKPYDDSKDMSTRDFIYMYESAFTLERKLAILEKLCYFIISKSIVFNDNMKILIKSKLQEAYFEHKVDEARGWYTAILGSDISIRQFMKPTKKKQDVLREYDTIPAKYIV